ncbi:Holliday junction branch migration protein RuvA [Candidatus Falkowbacteria bacterium]|uniref:Holliday junction branch migration complex subunit RuvA n=1 Tax=Candidatus Falkowbacteria bacterium CG10_big_fil_rev_8_21_14_0_10_37_18 TaxID=1974562 RepID=A0A2H0V8P3_9BACT|nr:Holliday junction branch migration protein RuvA [Candidatus Falkowbacteria bacterium]NCQ12598.1 Holliday junction branch migration protein RuvA [Candidatus Falkowbacteria bacterium]OIO05575.1 MAG: Holliday junction DNA helicase RuvA [Candidatus Falkowbacteria bacterium CG1_02_37_21]PIR95487.1 MAG: Holliday junction branch migration protein RuvA [Candidatus Falkowbacteria bacterium CG10_big_fil_rev_8_21_14_0_10_37_18]
MIVFLRGKVRDKGLNYAIIETGDIGYRVFAGENFLAELKIGTEAEVYTSHQIREDASDLYAFANKEDLELFELLLSVSGVGPKSALGVLSMATASDIKEAIIRGDANLLTKVSGIGKKTAERLVLELKNKVIRIGGVGISFETATLSGGDELDALISLGYTLSEARTALNAVGSEITDSGERVKAALKKIAKK